MSYTHPSAWQWYATADELINIRHFYSVNGVPVPVRPADGKQQGYYKTIDDKQNDRNYQLFYNQKYGKINKYGVKEYWVLKEQYIPLQQQISDKFDVITYKPNDRIAQVKTKGENTKISTKPPRRTQIKETTPIVIDTAQHEYEEKLRLEIEGQTVTSSPEPITQVPVPITQVPVPITQIDAPIVPISTLDTPFTNGYSLLPAAAAEPFTIIPTAEEPDKTTSANMINQEIISFSIVNNRVKGTIKFTATNSFNPYYYNKTITNYLQLQSKQVTLLIKTNNLRFTENERDELINFDENAFDLDIIDAQSYVWTQADAALSHDSTFTIQKDKPVSSSNMGFMGAGFAGGIAGLILLGFIADSRRKK